MPGLVSKKKATCKPSPAFLQVFNRVFACLFPFQKETETGRAVFDVFLAF